MKGWGTAEWGTSGWGAPGLGDLLELVSAVAVRENLVRLTFNHPLRYTDVRGRIDAADPRNYAIDAVVDSVGADGLSPRPVTPILIKLAAVANAGGRVIDVWLDRRLSPYPAMYEARCLRTVAANCAALGTSTALFPGLVWAPPVAANETTPATDLANPGYESAAIPGSSQILGVYPVTAQGDYGTDQGLVSYKKRIVRRLTTRRGAFAHLPNYGVGLLDEVKRLALPSTRQKIAADAEGQIRQEPETLAVEVRITTGARPGVFFFRVRARTRVFGPVSLDIPVSAEGT